MYKNIKIIIDAKNCEPEIGMAFLEVVNLFAGKWRMVIIATLSQEDIRFTEIQKFIPNITPRMLSKELKDLEMCGIVKRTVYDEFPVLIHYGLTNSAKEFTPIIIQMVEWAKRHRKRAKGK